MVFLNVRLKEPFVAQMVGNELGFDSVSFR